MLKLSLKQALAIAGLTQLVFLIVAVAGLMADSNVRAHELLQEARVQASMLRTQASEIDQFVKWPLPENRSVEPYRDAVRQRLRLLQSQSRALGIDMEFEVWPKGQSTDAATPAQTVREGFSLHRVEMVGHVDVRHPDAPGLLAMVRNSYAAKLILWMNMLLTLAVLACLAKQHRKTRGKADLASAGLDELVRKLIDAGKASNDARLLKLLDENAALVGQINQSAVGLEFNTSHLREARLGLSGTAASSKA